MTRSALLLLVCFVVSVRRLVFAVVCCSCVCCVLCSAGRVVFMFGDLVTAAEGEDDNASGEGRARDQKTRRPRGCEAKSDADDNDVVGMDRGRLLCRPSRDQQLSSCCYDCAKMVQNVRLT